MNLGIMADGSDYSVPDTIIFVTNWIAYNFPESPVVNTYDIGDSYDYQIKVENIAVEKLPGGGTQAMDISDSMTVQFGGLSGWSVSSDDSGWSPLGGVLNGLTAGEIYTWDITIELTSKVKAGESVLDFQAYSVDEFGMQNYLSLIHISEPTRPY